jgi:hypothetical protein
MPKGAKRPISLIPSPPNSPRSPLPTEPPERAPALEQQALKGEVREFVPPDHRWGESFPGRQTPTTQLSLFESGVFVKLTTQV